jgi:hypothetical protein
MSWWDITLLLNGLVLIILLMLAYNIHNDFDRIYDKLDEISKALSRPEPL